MFASRPEVAAAELARVCRRGGRVALATWLPDSNVFQMFMVMKAYMPPPPLPAPPSPFAWGSAQRLRELLGQDFDLKFEPGTTVLHESSGEAAWKTMSAGQAAEDAGQPTSTKPGEPLFIGTSRHSTMASAPTSALPFREPTS